MLFYLLVLVSFYSPFLSMVSVPQNGFHPFIPPFIFIGAFAHKMAKSKTTYRPASLTAGKEEIYNLE